MLKSWFFKHLDKLIWPAVTGMVVSILFAVFQLWLNDKSSDIVVRQFYNTVESKKAVPKQIGGLTLNYQPEKEVSQSVYVVEISNDGKGPEEDLRVQIGFPLEMKVSYSEELDFKVYRAEEVSLNQNKFFMSLKQFPSKAKAPVSFDVGQDTKFLCQTKIKVAGKEKEGRVETIKGIKCDI